jgi:phage terminase large subunit-like protein
MFGLRLGTLPQVFVSTTPKPIPLLRKLMAESKTDPDRVIISSGSTYENKANLAKPFFKQVAQYEGTRLGRQELHAELIDPRESGIITESWFKIYPNEPTLPDPKFELIIQSYDTAFTEKTLDKKSHEPDPSASSTWGIFAFTPAHRQYFKIPSHLRYGIMLLDCWTDYLKFPDLRARVKKEYDTSYYGPKGEERKADIVLIEDKGSGISLRQELQTVVPVVKYNPGRADKVQRLHVVSHIPCHGLVFLPESTRNPGKARGWADQLVDQVCTFPLVDNDDLVDTFSQALQYSKDQGWLQIDEPDEEEEYADTTRRSVNPYSR